MLVTVVLPGKTIVAPLSCVPASVVDELPIGMTMVNDESMVPLSVLAPSADVHVVGRTAVVVVSTDTGETMVKGAALVLDAMAVDQAAAVEAADEAADEAAEDAAEAAAEDAAEDAAEEAAEDAAGATTEDAAADDGGILDGDGVGVVAPMETRVSEETGITLVDVPPGRVLVTVTLVDTSTVVWLQ